MDPALNAKKPKTDFKSKSWFISNQHHIYISTPIVIPACQNKIFSETNS